MSGNPLPIHSWSAMGGFMSNPFVKYYRPGPATYIDRNGIPQFVESGMPQFDCDAVTGACKGVLFEAACTPLGTFGGQLDTPINTFFGAGYKFNAGTAPDGVTSVDRLFEDTTTATHGLARYYTSNTGSKHTIFAVVKSDQRNIILRIFVPNTSYNIRQQFDLSAGEALGSATDGNSQYLNGGIERLAAGYCFCWLTGVPDTAGAAGSIGGQILLVKDALGTYAGDGASGVLIADMNLYLGGIAQSIYPTGWRTASTWPLNIATGTQTMSVGYDASLPGQAIPAGASVVIRQTSSPANVMTGTVTSHTGTTLVVSITAVTIAIGTGIGVSDWTVSAGAITTRSYSTYMVPVGLLSDAGGNRQLRTEATLVVRGRAPRGVADGNLTLAHLVDYNTNMIMTIYRDRGRQLRCNCYRNGASYFYVPLAVVPDNTDFAVAVAFAEGSYGISIDGCNPLSGSTAGPPAYGRDSRLYYGGDGTSGNIWGGWLHSVQLYNRRLSNALLPALATY